MLARGGRFARNTYSTPNEDGGSTTHREGYGVSESGECDANDHFPIVNDGELARLLADFAVVIATGAIGSAVELIHPRVLVLPFLGFDYPAILPHVDLIVHHGKITSHHHPRNDTLLTACHLRRCRYYDRCSQSRRASDCDTQYRRLLRPNLSWRQSCGNGLRSIPGASFTLHQEDEEPRRDCAGGEERVTSIAGTEGEVFGMEGQAP